MKPYIKSSLALLAMLVIAACSQTQPPTPGAPPSGGNSTGDLISQTDLADLEPDSPQYFSRLIGDTVYFEVDQSQINNFSEEVLRKQAEWLSQNPDYSIIVEGHADEQGTREYNLALGARRAAAVKAYLVDLGIADFRLNTVSYGKERPVAVCSSESCWSKNRRSVTALRREDRG